MDFLDPHKRRAHNIRLMIGYFLMAIVIGLGTVILVYGADGYGINAKTGEIIQNGLLFADSKPGGAEIYLNGADQHTSTSARLVLPAGDYTLTLKKDGYRTWERKFVLNQQSIGRYVYPFLFPAKPQVTTLKSYTTQPPLVTESPDRHWLLVEQPPSATSVVFDEFDTGALASGAQQLSLPTSLLTNPDSSVLTLKEVEWSTDNNHLLLEHSYSGGHEFIILDRAHPDQSLNINQLLNTNPTSVSLRNKKIDQLYLYNQDSQSLTLGDTTKKTVSATVLTHALAFKSYGSNLLTYVTDTGVAKGQVQSRIWDNGQTYPLYTFNEGDTYLIDAAQFQGHWYYVAGSNKSDRINIYKDPLNDIKNPALTKALPVIALHVTGATKIKFSDNARFIGAQSGQTFGIYDMETQNSYQYTVKEPLSGLLDWMDGHRYIGQSGTNIFVMDYDGTNRQLVSPTLIQQGGVFSRDYNHLFSLTATADNSSFTLENIDMRAGTDLPKNPNQ